LFTNRGRIEGVRVEGGKMATEHFPNTSDRAVFGLQMQKMTEVFGCPDGFPTQAGRVAEGAFG
jgi:hypothetical protein